MTALHLTRGTPFPWSFSDFVHLFNVDERYVGMMKCCLPYSNTPCAKASKKSKIHDWTRPLKNTAEKICSSVNLSIMRV